MLWRGHAYYNNELIKFDKQSAAGSSSVFKKNYDNHYLHGIPVFSQEQLYICCYVTTQQTNNITVTLDNITSPLPK